MRLIDAEALKRNLCETCNQEACDGMPDSISECYSVRIIDEQPTAYDVDAVIKTIQKESYILVDECYRDGCVQVVLVEDALNIVKRGGIE